MVELDTTEEITRGPKLSMLVEPRTISEANNAPERGAL